MAATGLRIATKLLLCGGICGETTTVERLGVAARVLVTERRKEMQLLLVLCLLDWEVGVLGWNLYRHGCYGRKYHRGCC